MNTQLAKDIAICKYDLKHKAFAPNDKRYLRGKRDCREGLPYDPNESLVWQFGYKEQLGENFPRG